MRVASWSWARGGCRRRGSEAALHSLLRRVWFPPGFLVVSNLLIALSLKHGSLRAVRRRARSPSALVAPAKRLRAHRAWRILGAKPARPHTLDLPARVRRIPQPDRRATSLFRQGFDVRSARALGRGLSRIARSIVRKAGRSCARLRRHHRRVSQLCRRVLTAYLRRAAKPVSRFRMQTGAPAATPSASNWGGPVASPASAPVLCGFAEVCPLSDRQPVICAAAWPPDAAG